MRHGQLLQPHRKEDQVSIVEIWHGESGSLTGSTGVLGGGTFQGAKHAQAGAAWRQMPHVELSVELPEGTGAGTQRD